MTAALVTMLGTTRAQDSPAAPQALRAQVLAVFPHDRRAFTEGLEIDGVRVYESLGLYGRSEIREVDLASGSVLRRAKLPPTSFGEGLTVVGDTIWQATYQEHVAYAWDRATLALKDRRSYEGEGWGLCHHRGSGRLIMSSGSGRLSLRDPATFAETGSVHVEALASGEALRLNELECVDGTVWAVLWPTPRIAKIDIATGRVTAIVDASALIPVRQGGGLYELNGVAAVPGTDMFLLTGKHWPRLFQVRFER